MPLRYPILTETEVEDINDLRERISRFVNSHSEEAITALGRSMCNDHRTLVQSKGRLIRAFIQQLNEDYKNQNYDLRNQALCEWANDVLTKVDGPHLPFV